MQEGLFKTEFQTPFGSGVGVIHLQGGKIHGGNTALYYVGTYKIDGQQFQADLVTRRHTMNLNIASVFGVDTANVHMEGEIKDGNILIEGCAAEVPDMHLTGKFTFLCE